MKQTAVVIAPGRGTYNKTELGYLNKHGAQKELIAQFDTYRSENGQPTLTQLDRAERYSAAIHTRGDNASALIYACAYADFLSIDQDRYDIVGVTGNSMGWYIALACSGALGPMQGLEVVNTMGTLMQKHLIGSQIIYPYTDSNWEVIPNRKEQLLDLCQEVSTKPDHFLAPSIDLGGLLVLAGNDNGLTAFERHVPRVQERFPMRLNNHAGFHSALQKPVAELGQNALQQSLFQQPNLPLIDGRGAIWYPRENNISELYNYTLGHQVTEPYDLAAAIKMAAQELCPDVFIILGPGNTLSGSVAQSLIRCGWHGWRDKASFQTSQKTAPTLIAMGG